MGEGVNFYVNNYYSGVFLFHKFMFQVNILRVYLIKMGMCACTNVLLRHNLLILFILFHFLFVLR